MKHFLIVVDLQRDFVDGALGTPEAVAMKPRAVAKIRGFDGELFATLDTHSADYLHTAEGKQLPVEHCVKGTPGWELDADVRAALDEKGFTPVEKPTFGSLILPQLLRDRAGEEDFDVELIGLCTDICVISNALLLKASFPEKTITVDPACCAGVTPESHRAALTVMRSCQIQIREGEISMFDVQKITEACVQWVRDFFEQNGPGCNAVLGISGGKDSSVAAAVCVAALGKDRVIGVLMPNGVQHDIDMAYLLCDHLGIRRYEVNIHDAVEGIKNAMPEGFELSTQSVTNLPPRIRMATVYAVSQSCNGRVVNTCNLSEDWVGYSTRYGDSVGDFSPLSHLTVQEVKAVGRYLGLPEVLVEKPPIDGLCGKTDEDNLGFTYAVLDRYIRTGEIDDPATKELIDRKHRNNLFKLQLMPSFDPDIPTI